MRIFAAFALFSVLSFADATPFEIVKDGVMYTCSPGAETLVTCAEFGIQKLGYVPSDCSKMKSAAQNRCAVASLSKLGYLASDCAKIQAGGQCAETSIRKLGYLTSDCAKVTTWVQDRCAATAIEKLGYFSSSCLE